MSLHKSVWELKKEGKTDEILEQSERTIASDVSMGKKMATIGVKDVMKI